MSTPNYTDPTIAYNTGYNDGQREERDRICKEIEQFGLRLLLQNRNVTVPQFVGAIDKLRKRLLGEG